MSAPSVPTPCVPALCPPTAPAHVPTLCHQHSSLSQPQVANQCPHWVLNWVLGGGHWVLNWVLGVQSGYTSNVPMLVHALVLWPRMRSIGGRRSLSVSHKCAGTAQGVRALQKVHEPRTRHFSIAQSVSVLHGLCKTCTQHVGITQGTQDLHGVC